MRIKWSWQMKSLLLSLLTSLVVTTTNVQAQTSLSAYADANGFLDMHKLTCAQLANTWQEDADLLSAWYSGWYNGLAKKHFADLRKGKLIEHELILYCKANQGLLIIEAMAVVLRDERIKLGIHMK
jgi:hypothetical protein